MNTRDLYNAAARAGYPSQVYTGNGLGRVGYYGFEYTEDALRAGYRAPNAGNGLGDAEQLERIALLRNEKASRGQGASYGYNPSSMGYVGQTTSDLTASSDLGVGLTGTNDIGVANSNPYIDTSAATSINLPASDAAMSLTTSSPVASGLSSLFTGVITSLVSAGATTLTAPANAAALQATNAQRMASGLPPLNANGSVMTSAQMLAAGYTQAQVNQFASQLAAVPLTQNLPLLLGIAAVGVLAFMMMEKGHHDGSG